MSYESYKALFGVQLATYKEILNDCYTSNKGSLYRKEVKALNKILSTNDTLESTDRAVTESIRRALRSRLDHVNYDKLHEMFDNDVEFPTPEFQVHDKPVVILKPLHVPGTKPISPKEFKMLHDNNIDLLSKNIKAVNAIKYAKLDIDKLFLNLLNYSYSEYYKYMKHHQLPFKPSELSTYLNLYNKDLKNSWTPSKTQHTFIESFIAAL